MDVDFLFRRSGNFEKKKISVISCHRPRLARQDIDIDLRCSDRDEQEFADFGCLSRHVVPFPSLIVERHIHNIKFYNLDKIFERQIKNVSKQVSKCYIKLPILWVQPH